MSDEAKTPPDKLVRALVGRVDKMETGVDRIGKDVKSLGEGLAVLLRKAEGDDEGQPDWLSVESPGEAETLLLGTVTWMERFGRYVGLDVVPCWPWHPTAVVLLLAAAEHHQAAYAGKAPSAVSDYLTRTIPAVRDRLKPVLTDQGCNAHAHQIGNEPYTVDLAQLPDLAMWWVSGRLGVAPGLRRRVQSAG